MRWTEGHLAASQRPWRRRPRRGRSAWHACGWVSREPGRPRRLHRKDRRGAGPGSPRPRPWTQHLASDGAKPQVLGWYRRAQATKRGGMDGEESACLRVCAGQRVAQEGSSPSGALMESTVSKSGGHASLAVACGLRGGGQGVHREVESEGYEEQSPGRNRGSDPMMNWSAKDGARSSPHYGGEGVSIHPSHQGVCRRHGTEEPHVTPGGLARSSAGTEVSRPISLTAKWKAMSCEESDDRIVPDGR